MLLTLRVRDVRVETPRTRVVRLALDDTAFEYCAGQAVRIGASGSPLRKPYSIACSPEQAQRDRALELLVQVTEDGSAGTHLGAPRAGLVVDVAGPEGRFCFPRQPAQRDVLFAAGGTGIAPIRAMLWHALSSLPDRRLSLLYSVRTANEFAYADELRTLARSGRLTLRETVTREVGNAWAGDRGRITRLALASMLSTPATLCVVCGPPTFVSDLTGWLRLLGVEEKGILAAG